MMYCLIKSHRLKFCNIELIYVMLETSSNNISFKKHNTVTRMRPYRAFTTTILLICVTYMFLYFVLIINCVCVYGSTNLQIFLFYKELLLRYSIEKKNELILTLCVTFKTCFLVHKFFL